MELPAASGGESIKVFVRVRPPDPHLESELDRSACLDVTSQVSITVHCKPEPKVFTFDHVAGMETTQEDVFLSVGRPIIDSCMRGYNGTVFAYGQTGSGKTFTMIGPSDDSNNFTHELRGIIPRSFEYLFSLINREKQKYGDLVEFLCKCSFLEIYNEQVFDLIDPASCGLHLRENMEHGVYVDGLLETSVSSAREAYEVLSNGWANRRVAATSMNRESSRSHAVFTLTIESKKKECRDSVAKLKSSVLNLVDLAGSERQRDTQTAGVRLKEAGSINKSLSALGNVIMALVDIAHGKSRHVHYRDSKLTFLLRDSLGGNAKTNLVANVHPSARCFGESLSTLNFARRAKMIKNKAVVNENTTGNVLQLQAEIRRLKEQLQKFQSGGVEAPLSPTPYTQGVGSEDEKTTHELRDMLAASMSVRDKAEKDKMTLLDRVESLQKMCKQKDNYLQSTKMILKFRETHIANLEKSKGSEPTNTEQDAAVTMLKQEIEQLKYMVDHHPDVSKFAREALNLKTEIKRLKTSPGPGEQDLSKELARTHKYTLQLERQLRHFLAKDGAGCSPPTKRSSPAQSEAAMIEIENLKARCKHLSSELDKSRKSLQTEREEFHLKETKLEASLTATRKANLELERSIEALKLKNSVEKATLNDMHMNTIKSMLTPRRDLIQPSKAVSSTPYAFRRADSDPVKQLSLSFNGALTTPPKTATIYESSTVLNETASMRVGLKRTERVKSDDEEEVVNEVFSTPKKLIEPEELNIEGALTDELKLLQDSNRHLQQQIEDLEARLLHSSQQKTNLETQLHELTRLSQSERQSMQSREQECVEKISALSSQIATLTSCNTVLDSEVSDLRVCLRSADKEIAELKADMKEERHSHQTKVMEHMQRIGELEQQISTQTAGWDRTIEQLQNLQDEVETLREELTFKDHRISELGESVGREKEQGAALEKEVQSLLERLASEVEKNTTLSSELQEGSQGKEQLIVMVNENSKLKSEVEHLESELRAQLTVHKQELEQTERTISSLLARQSSDESAIAGFMATIQELREGSVRSEVRAVSLSKEVEDSNRELSEAAAKIDQLSDKVTSLSCELKEQGTKFERDLRRTEAEKEVILDDLDGLNEQYQQLQDAYDTQTKALERAESETQKLQEELDDKDEELTKLYSQQRERRKSISRAMSDQPSLSIEEKIQEIEDLKQRLDQAADMITKYETSQQEKNRELVALKEEISAREKLRDQNKELESSVASLQCKLSDTESQLQSIQKQLEEARVRINRLELESRAAAQEREKAVAECRDLKEKCQGQTNSIDALTQQIARYKSHEESLFLEKENLRSQLETIQEERSKLSKECEKLAKENALISGHQNVRQKIQYHATVKIENNKLREEVLQLRGRLKQKNTQMTQLHQLLNDKDPQPANSSFMLSPSSPSTSLRSLSNTDLSVKENVLPDSQ